MAISLKNKINSYFQKETKAAPLAVFRILFGLLMFISIVRFWYHGWIESIYINPIFHFKYAGFECVKVLGDYTYALFILCGISSILVAIGYKYRISIITFFLSFTYIELMDKTTYLNHYYFISIIAFMLIWLPANRYFSIDAKLSNEDNETTIPQWNIDVLKLMLSIVYIYAGIAKLNYDWLIDALPLKIWLSTKSDIPIIGSLLDEQWIHYLFSWSGAIYDLFIVFFLLWKPTRKWAFLAVVVFHLLTRVLFPIGMFPYIMIASTLIFFSAEFHEKIIQKLATYFNYPMHLLKNGKSFSNSTFDKIGKWILITFIAFQIIFPLRYLLYPGNVFWTEQGYRFSWRVMLMEKTGYANFKIVDSLSGKSFYVQNQDFLTPTQEKQMSTQPDMILEYGKFLADHFSNQGHKNIEVFVESYASLNGRASQPFINPDVNLLPLRYKELCQKHILPLND